MSVGSDCQTGKVQFATRAAATERANHMRARGATAVKAYRCPMCSCFHVGNTSRAAKKESVRR